MKGFRGFPSLAFMDAEGEVLTSNIERSVSGFDKTAAALAAQRELAAANKAGKLDAEGAAKLLNAELDLGKLDFAAASKRVAALPAGLSAATKTALEQRMVDLEVMAIFAKHQEAVQSEQQKLAMALRPVDGKAPEKEVAEATRAQMVKLNDGVQDAQAADFTKLIEAKRIPSDKVAVRFWNTLRLHAQRHKDDAMAQRAKQEMEAIATRQPDQKQMIERMLNPTQGRGAVPLQPAGGEKPADKGAADPAKKG